MRFAVLQKKLKKLDPTAIAPVYSKVMGLSDLDAKSRIAITPCGVLVENIEQAQALALQLELSVLGIETYVIEMDKLVTTKYKREMVNVGRVSPTSFDFEDSSGRANAIRWENIVVVSVAAMPKSTGGYATGVGTTSRVDSAYKAGTAGNEYYLDMYSRVDEKQIRIHYDKFNYNYLGARRGASTRDNFPLFVKDVCQACGNQCFMDPATRFVADGDYKSVPVFKELRFWDIENYWRLQMANNKSLLQTSAESKRTKTEMIDKRTIALAKRDCFPLLAPAGWEKRKTCFAKRLIDSPQSPLIAIGVQEKDAFEYVPSDTSEETAKMYDAAIARLCARRDSADWETEYHERDGVRFRVLRHAVGYLSASDILNPALWAKAQKALRGEKRISFAIPTRNCVIASDDVRHLLDVAKDLYANAEAAGELPISSGIFLASDQKVVGIQVSEPILVPHEGTTAALFSVMANTIESATTAIEHQYQNYIHTLANHPKFQGTVIFEIDTGALPSADDLEFPVATVATRLNQMTSEHLLSTVDGKPIEVICQFIQTDIDDAPTAEPPAALPEPDAPPRPPPVENWETHRYSIKKTYYSAKNGKQPELMRKMMVKSQVPLAVADAILAGVMASVEFRASPGYDQQELPRELERKGVAASLIPILMEEFKSIYADPSPTMATATEGPAPQKRRPDTKIVKKPVSLALDTEEHLLIPLASAPTHQQPIPAPSIPAPPKPSGPPKTEQARQRLTSSVDAIFVALTQGKTRDELINLLVDRGQSEEMSHIIVDIVQLIVDKFASQLRPGQ